jgi:hypothetical protein
MHADRTGHAPADILEMAQQTADDNTDGSKAAAIIALATALGAAEFDEDGDLIGLSAPSTAERSGLPVIQHEAHLAAALRDYHAGRHGGHDPKVLKAHLLARAKALGLKADLKNGDGPGRDKSKLKSYPKPKDNGTDGSDSFSSGGGETGGPSGSGSGGGVSMAARELLRSTRAGGGYSRADVLRLGAQSRPGQADVFLLAANMADLEDEQHNSAEQTELLRLSREHPEMFGLDPALVELSKLDNKERDVEGKLRSVFEAHPEYFVDRHDEGVKGKKHPVGRVTRATRAHAPEDASAEDPHASIQRYLRMQEADAKVNTQSPHGQHSSDGGPKPYRSPGPAGKGQGAY